MPSLKTRTFPNMGFCSTSLKIKLKLIGADHLSAPKQQK